jgi:hypothetical protein
MKDHNEELELVYWDEYLTVIDTINKRFGKRRS